MPIAQALLPEFDREMANTRECLSRIPADKLEWRAHEKSWDLRSMATHLANLPRIAVIRSTIMNHMIHHRGQLTVYLRLNGVPLPALYGPSADETG